MYKSNAQLPGALTSLTGLAKAIALPHEFAPQRFPSFPALERTAVMGFSVPTTWATSAASSNKFMLARQAVYPLWGDLMTPAMWAYGVTWESATAGFLEYTTNFGPNISNPFTGNVAATVNQLGVTGCNGSIVTTPVMGFDQGTGPSPWLYVPIGGAVTFYIPTVGANLYASSGQATLNIHVWTAPGQYTNRTMNMSKNTNSANFGDSISTTNATALASTQASSGGIWIRPAFYEIAATGSTVPIAGATIVVSSFIPGPGATFTNNAQATMTVSGSYGSQPIHVPLVIAPEIATSPLPWMACRTTAASVLLTNVTQVLNKAGTFLGGRVSPNVTNPFTVTRSYIANLHPAEKQQLCAEEGFYSFAPPSTDLANFWDHTCIQGGSMPGPLESNTAIPPLYRLDNDALVNVIYFDDSVAAAFSVTVDWHIEFRTSSALWQIAVSTMPLETLHSAQLLLHGVGYFFSNKWHMTLMKILSHLKSVSPIFGLAHTAGKLLISNKPQRTPKTTSLAGATGSQPGPRRRGKSKRPRRGKSAPPPRTQSRAASRPRAKRA